MENESEKELEQEAPPAEAGEEAQASEPGATAVEPEAPQPVAEPKEAPAVEAEAPEASAEAEAPAAAEPVAEEPVAQPAAQRPPSSGAGARPGDRERGPDDGESRPRPRRRGRRRVCVMCVDKMPYVDYKDFNFLRTFISDRGRIDSRRKTGTCAKHQRALAQAIKRARHLALIPYTVEHIRASGVGPLR